MTTCCRPDLHPQQPAQVELQADHEQQQCHAQVGYSVQRWAAHDAASVRDNARDQKPDQRRLADLPGRKSEHKGDADQNRVH